MSVRDAKRQQLKLTKQRQEAKDTKTKAIYQECLSEMKRDGIGRWFNKSKIVQEEDVKVKPIRNIFKMSRILVDVKPKSKDSKSLNKVNEKNSSNERNSETGSDQHAHASTDKGSDEDYEYSESSGHSDEDQGSADDQKKKTKKP